MAKVQHIEIRVDKQLRDRVRRLQVELEATRRDRDFWEEQYYELLGQMGGTA